MQTKDTNWSRLEVKKIGTKSVLTSSLIIKPLKTFHLQRKNTCQIIFSNYGGGYLEGDEIRLRLECLPDTLTLVSSQANTRVYKSETGGITKQILHIDQGDSSFVAYLNDAIVPQKNSLFKQEFHWKLGKNAVVLFMDWFVAGRVLNGERFAFRSFETELKIEMEEQVRVFDRFFIDPSKSQVDSPGAFGNHNGYVNIFLVGKEHLEKTKHIEAHLKTVVQRHFPESKTLRMNEFVLVGSATKVNEDVFMIRCSSKDNEALCTFVRDIAAVLESPELLGFSPTDRKY